MTYGQLSNWEALWLFRLFLLVVFASTGSTIVSKELLAAITSAALAVATVALFYLSKVTFQREEILDQMEIAIT